jgi:hypothetical protein
VAVVVANETEPGRQRVENRVDVLAADLVGCVVDQSMGSLVGKEDVDRDVGVGEREQSVDALVG